MKLMTETKKRQITGGYFWNIAILITLIVQAICSLVEAGLGVATVANNKSSNDATTGSTSYGSYTKNNGYLRLSKYPSKSSINIGVL